MSALTVGGPDGVGALNAYARQTEAPSGWGGSAHRAGHGADVIPV